MLTRIKEMYHQEALTLLYWLAYARSPPTLGELVDAAITDPNMESFIDISERGGLRDALNIRPDSSRSKRTKLPIRKTTHGPGLSPPTPQLLVIAQVPVRSAVDI
jgi:hypothetical protein